MRRMFKSLLAASVALAILQGAALADTIKIGSILSTTGPAAFLGDPEQKTLQLYVDQINKGDPIENRGERHCSYCSRSCIWKPLRSPV